MAWKKSTLYSTYNMWKLFIFGYILDYYGKKICKELQCQNSDVSYGDESSTFFSLLNFLCIQ